MEISFKDADIADFYNHRLSLPNFQLSNEEYRTLWMRIKNLVCAVNLDDLRKCKIKNIQEETSHFTINVTVKYKLKFQIIENCVEILSLEQICS